MALSDFERRQLQAIEQGLKGDGGLHGRRLWAPHKSIMWFGVGVGMVLSVLINVFSRAIPSGLFLVFAAALLIIIVVINRYTRSR